MIPDFDAAKKRWKLEGLTRDEVEGLLVLLDRRKFAAAYLKDPVTRKAWQVREYQGRSLNWYGPRKAHRSARSVGKTKDLEICALDIAMTDPDQEMMIGTQRKQHLEPLMERLIRIVTTVPDFKRSLSRKPQRSPDYRIDFKNGFRVWGRIAGPFGQNFQAMHVKYQMCEEAQEWTNKAWTELFPGLNPGGWRWVYGVPNGVRNKYYEQTEEAKKREYLFSWPRHLDPCFTAEDDEEQKRLCGGENSADYQHLVLGIHGRQRYSTFDYDHFQQCVNASVHCPVISVTGEDLKAGAKDFWARINFPYKLPFQGEKYLGCDIGYTTDPSEYVGYVFDGKYMASYFRIHSQGLKTNEQRDVITALDARHHFMGIGVDRNGIGLGVEHELQALSSRLAFIVLGFFWGESLVVGINKETNAEDKREAKSFATFLIEEGMRNGLIVFANDPAREESYINMTHEVRPNGYIVYSKDKDHIVDADRCAHLVKHMIKLKQQGDQVDLGAPIRAFSLRT